jgi:hypothetical protein
LFKLPVEGSYKAKEEALPANARIVYTEQDAEDDSLTPPIHPNNNATVLPLDPELTLQPMLFPHLTTFLGPDKLLRI